MCHNTKTGFRQEEPRMAVKNIDDTKRPTYDA